MSIESGADGITEAALKIYRAAAGFTLTGMHVNMHKSNTFMHPHEYHARTACIRI